MPLPLTTLDKLTYDELVAEARGSLPGLAPGWTNYNAPDPGITLVELLAWLFEGASYRLNNIPDESYRAFLRLAGVELRQAQVAETLIAIHTTAATLSLTKGACVQSGDGGTVFQTAGAVFVSHAQVCAVLNCVGGVFEDLTGRNASQALFLPLGHTPRPDDALYLGFDPVVPSGTLVSLGVWTGHPAEDLKTRSRLEAEQQAVEEEAARSCSDDLHAVQPDWRQHYGARTVWEYYGADGKWHSLQDVSDDTNALTLSGVVQFRIPQDTPAGSLDLSGYNEKCFIRCRLEGGAYDCPPRIAYVAMNAFTARHAVNAETETFPSNGRAGQRFVLAGKPVVANGIRLTVTLNSVNDDRWRVVPFPDGAGAHDRICLMDSETGILTFGDGRIGRVPPAGADITAEYQTGGGAEGNVPPQTLVQLRPHQATVSVEQPFAAFGGSAAETLNEAKARAVRELSAATRAVTLDDFETLALATPGVPVARAHAIPDYHPAMPCITVNGSTTVVVLPHCPEQRPEPTEALIARVQCFLERRRLLTSEIHVVGPHYTTVAVNARLQARPGTDRRALINRAKGALELFFHPLHGGPDGRGWPIGRAVYRAELLALLNNLNGVLYVEEMTWRVDGRPANRCGNIRICRHGLVASGTHEITMNEGSGCHA